MSDETFTPAKCVYALQNAGKFNKRSRGVLCVLLQRTYLGFQNTLICGKDFYLQQADCLRDKKEWCDLSSIQPSEKTF